MNPAAVASEFSHFARSLDHPLYIVTACAGLERRGCVMGFA